jgi:hypothetical protein
MKKVVHLMFNKKRKEKEWLVAYLNTLNRMSNLPDGYLESKQVYINCIEWLIAYYEKRTGCSPKEYLDSLIDNPDGDIRAIRFLYHWIKNKTIYGF